MIGCGSRLVGSGASAAVGSAVVVKRASRSGLPDGPDVGGRVRPAAGFQNSHQQPRRGTRIAIIGSFGASSQSPAVGSAA